MKKNARDDTDAEKARVKRLQKTVKKEKRAAIRELRKDNAFLASEKLKKRKLEDVEREKKVNLMYLSTYSSA
jgi:nucleolar protein 14